MSEHMSSESTAASIPGTSAVSDAMDQLGISSGVLWGTSLQTALSGAVAGPARVAFVRDTTTPGLPGLADFLDGVSPGEMLVLAWGADVQCSVFGDLAATRALRGGAVGAVIDGWCRDVEAVAALGFPVFARASTPFSGKGRLEICRAPQGAVVAGVAVADGDWVLADRTGVCAVRADDRERVRTLALELDHRDGLFRDAMEDGAGFGESSRRSGTL